MNTSDLDPLTRYKRSEHLDYTKAMEGIYATYLALPTST